MLHNIFSEYYIKGGIKMKKNLAIIGASGLVGMTVLKVLDEENLIDEFNITFYVSFRSAGKVALYKGKFYRFDYLDEKALSLKFDIVIFSAGRNVSEEWAKLFAEKGAFVIDNTSAFRMDKNIPLVVPEININLINNKTKIISNPNCSTIELAVVIDRLRKLSKIEKVVVSTFQSVSGAGRRAVSDLKNKTNIIFENGICDNIIPQIGKLDDNGFSEEENKLINELPKILNEAIDISATAVRVPVEICHGESVYVKFKKEVNLIDVYKVLECEYIKFSENQIFSLREVADSNLTYVCRIRQKTKNELECFVIADNLRRGAAYNAVLIAKHIIQNII